VKTPSRGQPQTDRRRGPAAPARGAGARSEVVASPIQAVLDLQRSAGNEAVVNLLDGTPTTIQRSGPWDLLPRPTTRKSHLDAFLSRRVRRQAVFSVSVVGDEWAVELDTKKNRWAEQYTPEALSAAAFAAAVLRLFFVVDLSPESVVAVHDRLLNKEIKFTEGSGSGFVMRTWVSHKAVESVKSELKLSYADACESLRTKVLLGTYLTRAFDVALDRFAEIHPLLSTDQLAAQDMTTNTVFLQLRERSKRLMMAELARTHRSARALRESFGKDRALRTGRREVAASDFARIGPAEWAAMLLPLALIARRSMRAAAKRDEERRRTEAQNEYLSPHPVSVADVAQFVLTRYNPQSTARLNVTGGVTIRGGDRFKNAKGETVFILYVDGTEIVYQNEADYRFYLQNVPGVESEYLCGVIALVAEKTRDIIPMTQVLINIMGAVFPAAGGVFLAAEVIDGAIGVHQHWDELVGVYERLHGAWTEVDHVIVPGVLTALVVGLITEDLRVVFRFELEPDPVKWLKLTLKLLRAKAAARFKPDSKHKLIRSLKEASQRLTVAFRQFQLVRSLLPSAAVGVEVGHGDSAKRDELTAALTKIGGTALVAFAPRLIELGPERFEDFYAELLDVGDQVGQLVGLVDDILTW
jgi:hypothetical protein